MSSDMYRDQMVTPPDKPKSYGGYYQVDIHISNAHGVCWCVLPDGWGKCIVARFVEEWTHIPDFAWTVIKTNVRSIGD